jgi:hypothetical protein
MKIYCKLCDKVQPVIIDNCRDAKTNAPFQDIVCKECHLVIAAGTDIQREWVGLTDEEIKEIVGPWGDTPIKGYTRKLFDQIEAKLKEKNT